MSSTRDFVLHASVYDVNSNKLDSEIYDTDRDITDELDKSSNDDSGTISEMETYNFVHIT